MDYDFQRKNMVDCQLKPNKVVDEKIIEAFLNVPREIFVNKNKISQSYIDDTLNLNKNRYLINPMIIAKMIQALNVKENHTILTLGSGIGYTSIILSHLCNTVIGIESIKSFYDFSSDILAQLDVNNVVIIKEKIENGYPDQQPYDSIIIEGGVNKVPLEILNQLSENGSLVAVEIDKNNIGKAVLYNNQKSGFIKNYLFDAYIPLFDGFKNKVLFEL